MMAMYNLLANVMMGFLATWLGISAARLI